MKKNEPNYTLNDKMISLVAEITEIATHLGMRESAIDPLLREKNRLKTIHSSLAIEQNTLTLQQVTDIIDGKRVFGPLKEIEEVKNAKAACAILEKVDPYSLKDLLKVHGLMVGGLTVQAGRFRTVEVGVYSGRTLVHAGTPHRQVPRRVKDLLSWVKSSAVHPLISSCVFHYGLEYIHPFSDGNGRMGRRCCLQHGDRKWLGSRSKRLFGIVRKPIIEPYPLPIGQGMPVNSSSSCLWRCVMLWWP